MAGPKTARMPAEPVTENPNEPIDIFAGQMHNQLRHWLKEEQLSLVANLRAESTYAASTQIWNHAVYKYESNMEEAPGGKETIIKIKTELTSNTDLPPDMSVPMPVDDDCRTDTYVYILEYASNGTINVESTNMNWLSCSVYAPANFAAVPLGIDWSDGVPSGITYTNVYDGLYQ